jgi:hypothetical protein
MQGRSLHWTGRCRPALPKGFPVGKQPTRCDSVRAKHAAYLVLQAVGFALPIAVTSDAVRSYRTISPLPVPRRRAIGGHRRYFLRHFPAGHPGRPLAATVPCPARTFLRVSFNPATVRPTYPRTIPSKPLLFKCVFGDRKAAVTRKSGPVVDFSRWHAIVDIP